jgi:hypothetical protein
LDPSRLDRARVLELLRAVREPDKDYAKIAERLVPPTAVIDRVEIPQCSDLALQLVDDAAHQRGAGSGAKQTWPK